MTRQPIATVSFNMKPVSGPWGGSSVFVRQCSEFLSSRGYRVRYDLKGIVDVIVMIDPRLDNRHKRYGLEEIAAYRKANPRARVLHRINECDQRKGSSFMDALLGRANELADYTVFISSWLRDYFVQRWFDPSRPHASVYNGADSAIYHPVGSARWDGREPLRVVTHHWSDNPLKGFDVYQKVDELIADGELPGFRLEIIGRWPADIRWRSARATPAAMGRALAKLLRGNHLYLTASRWEPCGMHHVEGAQCGLPLVCHANGGGIVEAGRRYGIVFRNDVKAALLEARERYRDLRSAVLAGMPDGLLMCRAYEQAIRSLLIER